MPESRQETPGNPIVRKRLSSLLALVVLAVVASICISLGFWQLDRAAERDALHQTIESGRLQAPISLNAATPSSELIPWRAATVQGRWLNEHTVLLQNRNWEGRPGYWVATPLQLSPTPLPSNRLDAVAAGSAEPASMAHAEALEFLSRGPGARTPAVLVLRGWLPRNMQAGEQAPAIPQEEGLVQLSGELHSHVPRIFELWEWAGGASSKLPASLPQADGKVAQVQNLELEAYAQASGLSLLPIVLAQETESTVLAPEEGTGQSAQPQLIREWPGPELDSDKNRGYALQWFSFSGIALIAALFVLRSLLRREPKKQGSKEAS